MSLIIATGANLHSPVEQLKLARHTLCQHFQEIAASRIYRSPPVGVTDQPEFFNQVLEFELPEIPALHVLEQLQAIEKQMGRVRVRHWGPRIIDLDLLFFGLQKIDGPALSVPHPRLWERSFVILPLRELPFFKTLEQHYSFAEEFHSPAYPVA